MVKVEAIDVVVCENMNLRQIANAINQHEAENYRTPKFLRLDALTKRNIEGEMGFGKITPGRIYGIPWTMGGDG